MSELGLHAREFRLRLDAVADVQHADETQRLSPVSFGKVGDVKSVSYLIVKGANLHLGLEARRSRKSRHHGCLDRLAGFAPNPSGGSDQLISAAHPEEFNCALVDLDHLDRVGGIFVETRMLLKVRLEITDAVSVKRREHVREFTPVNLQHCDREDMEQAAITLLAHLEGGFRSLVRGNIEDPDQELSPRQHLVREAGCEPDVVLAPVDRREAGLGGKMGF